MKKIDYSIIIPVYCNGSSLKVLYDQLINELSKTNIEKLGEIIFVDDGSYDDSYDKLKKIKGKHDSDKVKIKIIKLIKNYGQTFAIQAGYSKSKGECIINLAADLQDPINLVSKMMEIFFKGDYEIIIAKRVSREDSFFRNITSNLFYWVIKKLSFYNMPSGGFDIALISHKIKEYILTLNDTNPFWQGQILSSGSKIKVISYSRMKRVMGISKWTLTKRIKYLIDGVLAFSYFPIRFMSLFGISTSFLGILYAIYIFIIKLFGVSNIEYGWAPIMIVILIIGGTQMVFLGIMGEYIWRTLSQVRNRPKYIIEKILE